MEMKAILYSKILPDVRYNFAGVEKTSLSSELLTLRASSISNVGWEQEIYIQPNYSKSLEINHPWYDVLLERAKTRDSGGNLWKERESISSTDLEECNNSRFVYFVNGDLAVNPADYENLGRLDDISGCIFVVRGNVTITEGEYKSRGKSFPHYDIMRGFFLVDGIVNIPFVDGTRDPRDGLKVVGGLFATGGQKSMEIGRCLASYNEKFPVFIGYHDARYLDLAREVFGSITYIKDIGFKE